MDYCCENWYYVDFDYDIFEILQVKYVLWFCIYFICLLILFCYQGVFVYDKNRVGMLWNVVGVWGVVFFFCEGFDCQCK